jgi:hypothetical protein
MLRAQTTKATLTILALFLAASTIYSQQSPRPPTYKVPGDPTIYSLAPSTRVLDATELTPVAGASSPNPKAPEPISYFHLEFVVNTLDSGKVTSSHTYTMDANTDRNYHASYRSDTSEGASSRSRNRTDIDCGDVHLVGTDSISLSVTAMINTDSNPAPPGEMSSSTYNGSFYTLAVLGKTTIVFSADAQAPNRKIQMEVTATPIHLNLPPKP